MNFGELKGEVASFLHDPQMITVSESMYERFINAAIDDAKSSGWLLPIEEDESTTVVADTYDYDVPADFAYINHLVESNSSGEYIIDVPLHHWGMGYDGGNPQIQFKEFYWTPTAGRTIKVIGQQRPSKYSADSDTVEDGFIGFLRERAMAKALEYLTLIPIEETNPDMLEKLLAVVRQRVLLVGAKLEASERMLSRHPMEFRVRPSSRHVPTR